MKQNKETRFIPATELRAVRNDDGTRTISGYAAKFNTLSNDIGFFEMIAPGAFTRTLQSNQDVVCVRDHDTSILFGRTSSKTLSVEQDSVGLKFTCSLPSTTQASDIIALIDRGDIADCSFRFVCNKDDWNISADGLQVRTLLDVDLFDVSVVTYPAYPDTSVAVRNAPPEVRSALEKLAKRDDDDTTTEEASTPKDTDCMCPCDPCVDGDCDGCTDDDCDVESCSCQSSSESFRNKVHFILELAKHK